ncbi:Radial spoke head protein 3 [Orchesella cincta]|uniref:Radial spoke head protein 3 n=1 Tax=Orchesella cincta TaxID=48709 RepID=A0A1D2NEZ4_ORCCI|nr:Radial spoke head protein 3 [Orchesella cincta]
MAKPSGGVKDVGNYRFFIFSTTPKKVNVTASSVCIPGEPSRRGKTRQYGNVMWDPRVCRGMYVASSKNGRSTQPSRCDLPRKKKLIPQTSALLPPNSNLKKESTRSVRSRTVSILSNSSIERAQGTSRSVTPPPVEGRLHVVAQTDPYFEPLEDDERMGESVEIQTEEIMDSVIVAKFPPHLVPVNSDTCEERGTQCELWDVVDIIKAYRPVSENLILVVIEQALKEIMDEYELESLIVQQNRYKQILSEETLKGEAVRRNLAQAKVIKEKDNEKKRARRQHEAHHLLNVINFSSNYMLDFAEKSMEKFGEEWQNANVCEPINCQFRRWVNEETGANITRFDVSKKLTDEIIKRVTNCEGENNQVCRQPPRVPVNSVVNIQQVVELKDELEVPGEYENEDQGNLPVSTIWNEDSSGSKKSSAFYDDSVTESERSESQNENDTD